MSGSDIFIEKAIELAWVSRRKGNHPFGALLVDKEGKIILEAENTVVTENDITGHAETNLVREAVKQFHSDTLKNCTLYTSTEPCPMCSGAIYWSNIGRVVFGLSQKRFYQHLEEINILEALKVSSEYIFNKGWHKTLLEGPILESAALKVHLGFWENLENS